MAIIQDKGACYVCALKGDLGHFRTEIFPPFSPSAIDLLRRQKIHSACVSIASKETVHFYAMNISLD